VERVTRVKICGITRAEDAELATELGAWALGFILWDRSPRAADPGLAVRYRRSPVLTVAVFVDPTLDEVVSAVEGFGFDAVQLHGSVGTSFCNAVRQRTAAQVIRAFAVNANADVQSADAFREVDYHLYDTRTIGGTGETFDWALAHGRRSHVPLILSGGLTPDNVADGIAATHPYAVDVASGTEAEPGVKDPEKVRAFIEAAAGVRSERAALSGGERSETG
jgi:phosphoribosylanthranilate isomerase